MTMPPMDALRRMSLANIRTGEAIDAQYNPTKLKIALKVAYERLVVPGMSHQILQYKNTENVVTELELFCAAEDEQQQATNEDFERFLSSLCYPSETASTVETGAPPRVLFLWPTLATLTCVVTGLDFEWEYFGVDMRERIYKATVGIEEIRDFRLTSEEVRVRGFRRASASSSGSSGT